MYTEPQNPYETIYHLVCNCGSIHTQKDFSINVLHTFASIFSFDQARIYFFNGNGKVSDQYLLGADIHWANAYHEYYSKIEGGRYSVSRPLNSTLGSKVNLKCWSKSEIQNNEFYQDYVLPQGIKSTVAFTLFDTIDSARATFMFDRTSQMNFSQEELRLVELAYPQLNNLHKNFFSNCNNLNRLEKVNWKITDLTAREIDVTTLLCQGVSPNNISQKLHIALPTVNKHISHIYAKMQVSSRQELLVRIMNQ